MSDGKRSIDPYHALRFRNYRLYIFGHMLSIVGLQIQAVAVGWEIYDRTGSALLLGFIGLAQFVPIVGLALPFGHAADRGDRRLLLFFSQCIATVSALGLALLSVFQGPVILIYGCLVLAGISQSMSMVTRSALLSLLVPTDALTNAVTTNFSARQIATISGPAIGGVLISLTGGTFTPYLLSGACTGAFALMTFGMRPAQQEKAQGRFSFESFLSGWSFLLRTPALLAAIFLDLFAVLLGGAVALLPMFAKDILHVGATGLGFLRAAPAVGAIITTIILTHLPPMRHAGRTILAAVAGFGCVMIGFGLSQSFLLSLTLLALSGAFDTLSVVVRQSLVQLRTPDVMRGRVAAVSTICISSSNELGEFESGVTAQFFGPMLSVVLGGIGTVLVVAVIACAAPDLRRLRTLHSA